MGKKKRKPNKAVKIDKSNRKQDTLLDRKTDVQADVSPDMWREDSSLIVIGKKLADTPNAVLSLDFFDTLICRLCNEPTDMFSEVGVRLEANELLQEAFTASQFRELRRAAEMKARQRRFWNENTTEVTLLHIYKELHPAVVSQMTEAAECELQIETEYCFVNPYVESLLKYAKSLGCRICILSDMYLSANDLKRISLANGLDLEQVSLVATSCENGAGKTSGALFKYAMQKMQVTPDTIFHLGDNDVADVKGAGIAGIQGFLYYRTNDNSNYVYPAEKKIDDSDNSFGINAIRTLAERNIEAAENAFVHAGCFTLGPVLTHFADWCVKECVRNKITKVLAFMREGRLLRELMRKSAASMNVELQIEEFYVSRQAVHLASVGESTKENITERVYARTVNEMFESFGIGQNESQFPDHIGRQEVKTVEMLSTLVNYLTTGRMKDVVEQRSAEARDRFIEYFKSLVNHSKVAFIDVGWGGSMQRNIVRILELEGVDVECHGFYLANTIAACQVALKGAHLHGFLSSHNEHPRFMEMLVRSPEMIEQAASASIGSTIGYRRENGRILPVLSNEVVDKKERQRRTDVQKGIHIYQNLWLKINERKRAFVENQTSRLLVERKERNLSSVGRAIIQRLINYPTGSEACSLGHFHHDDGFFSNSVQLIASPSKTAILENDGYNKMKDSPKTYWPQAILAQADEMLVKQLACGMECDVVGKQPGNHVGNYIGKVTHGEILHDRHESISSSDIADIRISAGDWLFYNIEIDCPDCGKTFETRLVGTYTVLMSVSCTKCGGTFVLGYDAIDRFLDNNYPDLAGEMVNTLSAKTGQVSDEINVSLSEQGNAPLLASLANMICVNSLSRLVCKEIVSPGDPE